METMEEVEGKDKVIKETELGISTLMIDMIEIDGMEPLLEKLSLEEDLEIDMIKETVEVVAASTNEEETAEEEVVFIIETDNKVVIKVEAKAEEEDEVLMI